MVKGRLPGQMGAIFHFRPYGRFPGGGKGLNLFEHLCGKDVNIFEHHPDMSVKKGFPIPF